MKRLSFFCMCMVLTAFIWANDAGTAPRRITNDAHSDPIVRDHTPATRDFSWHITPQNLITNFYDYMPGSYNANPMRFQFDDQGEMVGMYGVFHGEESAASLRRVYYFYMDDENNIGSPVNITQESDGEGYPNVVIDPETNNPLVVYHTSDGSSDVGGLFLVYDVWSLLNTPGMLSSPSVILDNTTQSGIDTPNDFDEFSWPYVYISEAPSYAVDHKRRLYVIAYNGKDSDADDEIVCENILIAYKDFSTDELINGGINVTPWHYITFPYLDAMSSGTPPLGRYFHAMDVTMDGRLAVLGHLFFRDPGQEYKEAAMLFYNDNFGEGEWDMTRVELTQPLYNPTQPDSTLMFDTEFPLYWGLGVDSHIHTYLGQDEVRFITNMTVTYDNADQEPISYAYYRYMKEIVMNLDSHETRVVDLYPQGVDPDDGVIYIPWDENEDGEFDEVDENGSVNSVLGWPIWYHDDEDAFHENWQKYAWNRKFDWRIAMWQDGMKNKLAQAGEADYVQWTQVPELYIQVWNGESYASEPIVLNALDTPELAGMIPIYWYPSTDIIDLGNGYGRVYLMFLDDYDYGSNPHDHGPNTGGMMKLCALDIYFGYHVALDPVPPQNRESQLGVYPNPFNPLTKVKFSVPESGNAEVTIHNIRGQKVKTLYKGHLQAGTHSFSWNGTDDNGTACSTGVYLVKGTGTTGTRMSKVTLLK